MPFGSAGPCGGYPATGSLATLCPASSPSATCSWASSRSSCRSAGELPAGGDPDRSVDRARHHRRSRSPSRGGDVRRSALQFDPLADLVSFGRRPPRWCSPGPFRTKGATWPAWEARLRSSGSRVRPSGSPASTPLSIPRPTSGTSSASRVPGATLVVIATILALQTSEHGPWMLVPVGVSVIPALLMITTVRFRSFRGLLSPRTRQARVVTSVMAAALVIGTGAGTPRRPVSSSRAPPPTAPLGVLTAPMRARIFGAQAVAPPRTRMQSVFLPMTGGPAWTTRRARHPHGRRPDRRPARGALAAAGVEPCSRRRARRPERLRPGGGDQRARPQQASRDVRVRRAAGR